MARARARVEGGLSVRGSDANPAAKTGEKKITPSSTSARVTTGNNAVRQYASRTSSGFCAFGRGRRGALFYGRKKRKEKH